MSGLLFFVMIPGIIVLGFIVFGLTMGQLLNIAMFFIGIYFITKLK